MRVLFVDGTEGHNPKELYEKPTGGTLTSLTKVPEYLASKGHEVFVTSSHKTAEVVNGVTYVLPGTALDKWDITVLNRNLVQEPFVNYCKQQGSKIIWWLHDIVDTRYLEDGAFKKVDKIVALSQYCKDTFADFYEINPDKFTLIPNGIDPEVYYPGKYEDRNQHLFITASAPIKGQAALEPAYLTLKRHDIDLDFRVYSSQKLHGKTDSASQSDFLQMLRQVGVHTYAPTSQKVMSDLMRKAYVFLMPNSYPEICSNLLLQARACGCPVVASGIGANSEFIEHRKTGMLTSKWQPHDLHSWTVEFTKQACILQKDKDLHRTISANAPMGVMTWGQVGEAWNELLKQLS